MFVEWEGGRRIFMRPGVWGACYAVCISPPWWADSWKANRSSPIIPSPLPGKTLQERSSPSSANCRNHPQSSFCTESPDGGSGWTPENQTQEMWEGFTSLQAPCREASTFVCLVCASFLNSGFSFLYTWGSQVQGLCVCLTLCPA